MNVSRNRFSSQRSRKQRTAAEVPAACAEAGLAFPDLTIDPSWDEFDFHGIYQEIAPLMC